MTPSPSPTPPSSPSSRPASSPADAAVHDLSRSFAPRIPPPFTHISHHPDIPPPSFMGTPGPSRSPSMPIFPESSYNRPRRKKHKSDESLAASSSEPHATEEDDPTEAEQNVPSMSGSAAGPSGTVSPKQQGKKKRTRTLTTPHQSAVLHALLAQSRFPTTAMREEVGRSIGLSARKVQVWFQNQRQKARKPRTQSTAPVDTNRPPQFGPFSAGPSTDAGPVAGPSGVSGSLQGRDTMGVHTLYTDLPPSSVHPSGLPAPHPGQPSHPHHRSSDSPEYTGHRPIGQETFPRGSMQYSLSPISTSGQTPSPQVPYFVQQNPQYHSGSSYSPDDYLHHSIPGSSRTRDEPPIRLPPLRFDQARESQMRGGLPPPPLQGLDPHFLPRSASFPSTSPSDISSRSSSQLPSPFQTSEPSTHLRANIPPPFTLQPTPQWETDLRPRLNPPVGPSQSSLSHAHTRHRTTSDPTRVLPPLSIQGGEQSPLLTQPWPLPTDRVASGSYADPPRRFDPVHSAIFQTRQNHPFSTDNDSGIGSGRNRHSYNVGRSTDRVQSPRTVSEAFYRPNRTPGEGVYPHHRSPKHEG